MKIIESRICGGKGEDDNMTAPEDLEYTIKKLIKIALLKGLQKPYVISILPKNLLIEEYQIYKVSKMVLIAANEEAIETNNLVWKSKNHKLQNIIRELL